MKANETAHAKKIYLAEEWAKFIFNIVSVTIH